MFLSLFCGALVDEPDERDLCFFLANYNATIAIADSC